MKGTRARTSLIEEEEKGGGEEEDEERTRRRRNERFLKKPFWESIGKPQFVMAPMVDASELPFRLLCRRYGVQLAYTPMLHSRLLVEDPKYRAYHWDVLPKSQEMQQRGQKKSLLTSSHPFSPSLSSSSSSAYSPDASGQEKIGEGEETERKKEEKEKETEERKLFSDGLDEPVIVQLCGKTCLSSSSSLPPSSLSSSPLPPPPPLCSLSSSSSFSSSFV
ncbi:dihydrouridine synthase protein, partial [Cystoisospora suis]